MNLNNHILLSDSIIKESLIALLNSVETERLKFVEICKVLDSNTSIANSVFKKIFFKDNLNSSARINGIANNLQAYFGADFKKQFNFEFWYEFIQILKPVLCIYSLNKITNKVLLSGDIIEFNEKNVIQALDSVIEIQKIAIEYSNLFYDLKKINSFTSLKSIMTFENINFDQIEQLSKINYALFGLRYPKHSENCSLLSAQSIKNELIDKKNSGINFKNDMINVSFLDNSMIKIQFSLFEYLQDLLIKKQ